MNEREILNLRLDLETNFISDVMCVDAFSVASPAVWKFLPDFIWDPTISADCVRRWLKTYLFARC